ncbi:hypothetical protein [Streptomyces sp. NPDC001020]
MTTSPKWRVALASAASTAVFVAAPLVGAQTAHAQYPPTPPSLTLSTTAVPVGGSLTFRGTGFAPNRLVVLEFHSREVVLGRYRTNGQGTVTGRVTIPRRAALGYHVLELEQRNPHLEVTAVIKVLRRHGHDNRHGWHGHNAGWEGPGRSEHHHHGLADSGSEKALAVGGTAAGLIAAGGGTMLAVRRRRSS